MARVEFRKVVKRFGDVEVIPKPAKPEPNRII
jgi:hypothetical protein